MKRKSTILVLAIISIFTLSACGTDILSSGNEYVSVVKDGNFYEYPDVTVGEAFDDFFYNPSWEYFVSDNGYDIVEFNGEAEYLGEDVNICIQFEVVPDTGEFEVFWSDINEYEMSLVDYNDMIDTIFGY